MTISRSLKPYAQHAKKRINAINPSEQRPARTRIDQITEHLRALIWHSKSLGKGDGIINVCGLNVRFRVSPLANHCTLYLRDGINVWREKSVSVLAARILQQDNEIPLRIGPELDKIERQMCEASRGLRLSNCFDVKNPPKQRTPRGTKLEKATHENLDEIMKDLFKSKHLPDEIKDLQDLHKISTD